MSITGNLFPSWVSFFLTNQKQQTQWMHLILVWTVSVWWFFYRLMHICSTLA